MVTSGLEDVRRMFGLVKEEVTGRWRRLHNSEYYNLYSSLNDVRVIESRRTRYAEVTTLDA
jgi:hypothetical protein